MVLLVSGPNVGKHHPPDRSLSSIKGIRKTIAPSIRSRGYYMAAQRYEISLRLLKNISGMRAANK